MADGNTYVCGCVVFGSAQFCKMHAAAPELLAAAKLAVEWERDYRTRNNLGKQAPQPFTMLEAAIRKATVGA